jgi:hypothetical protein
MQTTYRLIVAAIVLLSAVLASGNLNPTNDPRNDLAKETEQFENLYSTDTPSEVINNNDPQAEEKASEKIEHDKEIKEISKPVEETPVLQPVEDKKFKPLIAELIDDLHRRADEIANGGAPSQPSNNRRRKNTWSGRDREQRTYYR